MSERRRPRTLAEEVHDTPVKPLSSLDVRLARYNADLDSIPPPQSLELAKGRVIERMHRDRIESGQWDVEEIQRQSRALADEFWRARIAEEARRADSAEAELKNLAAEGRKFRATIVAGIVIGLVVAAVCWATAALVAASHH